MSPGAVTLARLLMSRNPARLVAEFYAFVDPIFEAVTQGSGLINVGLADEGSDSDLAEAQRRLVRHTTRDLPRSGATGTPRWLEVGCGWGGPSALLAGLVPEVRIVGLDISPDHVHAARRRAATNGLGQRVRHYVGDAQAIPFPDAVFDAVYGIETAFHYPRKHEFVHEARRVLRPNGRLALADFVFRPEHANRLERLAIGPNMRIGAMPGLFTPADWQHTLEERGFQGVEVEDVTTRVIGLLDQWAARLREHDRLLRTRYPRPLLTYYTVGLERLSARAETSPIGYVVVRGTRSSSDATCGALP